MHIYEITRFTCLEDHLIHTEIYIIFQLTTKQFNSRDLPLTIQRITKQFERKLSVRLCKYFLFEAPLRG